MSYDNPNRIKYTPSAEFDFGGGADGAFYFRGPKGKAGRIYDYGVEGTTEVFAGSGTTPKISIGTAADHDAYGDELDLAGVPTADAKSVLSTTRNPSPEYSALMVDPNIPADAKFGMFLTAGVGTPTGIGVPFVIIDWDL